MNGEQRACSLTDYENDDDVNNDNNNNNNNMK